MNFKSAHFRQRLQRVYMVLEVVVKHLGQKRSVDTRLELSFQLLDEFLTWHIEIPFESFEGFFIVDSFVFVRLHDGR